MLKSIEVRSRDTHDDGRSTSGRQISVLHVIVALNRGGAETALLRMIEHSDPERIKHTVLMLRGGGALVPALERLGCGKIEAGLDKGGVRLIDLVRSLQAVRLLRPDVVQGWMVHGNLAASFLRLMLGSRCALAWNLRTTARSLSESRAIRILTRVAAGFSRLTDLLISNSHLGLMDHLALGYSPRSHLVIPNGFDTDKFRPHDQLRAEIRRAWGVDDHHVLFGIVGRRDPLKGHPLFVQAAGDLLSRRPDAKFILIGDGLPDDEFLSSLIDKLDLRRAVQVLGGRDDIDRVLPAIDVLCLSSFCEGFPNVVGEGMSAGVACVATDVSDVRMILGDTGLVVGPGDPAAFADAMQAMVDMGHQARRRLGQAGRQRVRRHYSIDRIAAQYDQVYQDLASAASSRRL